MLLNSELYWTLDSSQLCKLYDKNRFIYLVSWVIPSQHQEIEGRVVFVDKCTRSPSSALHLFYWVFANVTTKPYPRLHKELISHGQESSISNSLLGREFSKRVKLK